MNQWTVHDKEITLFEFLQKVLPESPRTQLKKLLKFRSIQVNQVPTGKFDYHLHPGDCVALASLRELKTNPNPRFGVRILFEDDDLIVVDKPSGLLTIATEKIKDRTAYFSVNDYLNQCEKQRKFGGGVHPHRGVMKKKQIFLVHRLDRDTSGVMIFAKSEQVKLQLQDHWDKVRKIYFAVAEGIPQKFKGTIQSYLKENKMLRVFTTQDNRDPEARLAITHYRVLKKSAHYSLLEIDLETGRKHQIRVHLAEMGNPIAGDKDYGAKTNPAGRLMLHAFRLTLPHPRKRQQVSFESPMPESFKRLFHL